MKRLLPILIIQNAILFAFYFTLAKIGLSIEAVSGFATLVWPPAGIALAALLIFGYRLWPGIFIGAFLVNLSTGAPLPVALGMGIGNTLEAITALFLLKHLLKFNPSLEKLSDTLSLILIGGILSPVIASIIGVTSLVLGGIVSVSNFGQTWIAWWIGDMLGILIITPLILIWKEVKYSPLTFKRFMEAGFLWALLLLVILFVFYGKLFGLEANLFPFNYLLFLPLILISIRLGKLGAVTAIFLVSVIAIWCTLLGWGPFIQTSVVRGLLFLQTFMAVITITMLILATLITQRKMAEEEIKTLNQKLAMDISKKTIDLNQAQHIAHVGSWEWDIHKNQVIWSDEMYRIYGYKVREFEVTFEKAMERVVDEDKKIINKNVGELLKNSQSGQHQIPGIDYTIVLPNGNKRMLHGESMLLVGGNGKPLKLTGTVQDVTQSRQAQLELERMNKSMVGRELKMVELKKELANLKKGGE